MVIQVGEGYLVGGLQNEVDRFAAAFGIANRIAQDLAGEDGRVDRKDLLARRQLSLVGGAIPADISDGAVGADADTDGVPDVDDGACAPRGIDGAISFAGMVGVVKLVAGALDAVEIGARGDR